MSWIENTNYRVSSADLRGEHTPWILRENLMSNLYVSWIEEHSELRYNSRGVKDVNSVVVETAGDEFRVGTLRWSARVRFFEWKAGTAPEWVTVWGTLNPVGKTDFEVIIHEW